jgi:hypothetical protein
MRDCCTFLEMGSVDSITALNKGNIDGMFLTAGLESGNAQALIHSLDLNILDFKISDALTKWITYADVVTVPPGALNLFPLAPTEPVHMLATTTTILTHQTLSPVVQDLFLSGARSLYQNNTSFFDRPGGFPAFIDKNVPRSPIAERYLSEGKLPLEGVVPFWIASFIDVAWFWILAILAISYPLIALWPSYRTTVFRAVESRKYSKIFDLYREVKHAANSEFRADVKEALLTRCLGLENELQTMWRPKGCSTNFAHLLKTVQLVKQEILALKPIEESGRERPEECRVPADEVIQ